MEKKKLIIPRKLQGFWELMPKEQMLFSSLLNKLEKVFQENCFMPLDTPVLEYSEALLAKSGGETDKQIFRFTKGETDMCMRYDLTVPLARFVAMHENELNFPFKRYQIGKVYRGERPQKGRFREFYQCDADIIGEETLSMIADAECVNLYDKCFSALDIDITIKISNRKILAGFISSIGKENNTVEILTVLDKLEKIPFEQALEDLKNIGLDEEKSEKIIKLTKICGNFEEIMQNLNDFCENELFIEGLNELTELEKYLKALGTQNYIYDFSIIRGHDYYTGTVFETFLKDGKEAVGGGGRYENLCGFFSNKKMPGVGMSIGITRLFDLLLQKNYFDLSKFNETELAIITFDETLTDGLKLMTTLRKEGIKAECLYENKSFKSKMKEANRRQINFVVIVGENEVTTQKFALKNMQTGLQEECSIEKIVERVKDTRMQTQN